MRCASRVRYPGALRFAHDSFVAEPRGFAAGDVKRSKAEAVLKFTSRLPHADTLRVTGIPESVLSLSALAAIKEAEVILCCVDNASARYAAAFVARLYLKPILDDFGASGLPGLRVVDAGVRDNCRLCSLPLLGDSGLGSFKG